MANLISLGAGFTIPENDALNAAFAQCLLKAGGTMTGTLILMVGTTSSPPLLFHPGTATTVPQDGAMEYAGNHFLLTSGTARHPIATSGGVKTSTTTVVNTTTDTTIYTYTFEANELHADEKVTFIMSGVYSNATASDDFTIRMKWNGSTIQTVSRVGGNLTNQGWKVLYEATVRTSGASGTYVDFIQYTDGSNSYVQADTTTHSIDTTASNVLTLTVQWANAKAGNTFSCTQGSLLFEH